MQKLFHHHKKDSIELHLPGNVGFKLPMLLRQLDGDRSTAGGLSAPTKALFALL